MKSYIEEGLDSNTVSRIQKKYRCAWCWNPILVKHDKDGDYLDCGTDGCRSSHLVSNFFVEKQMTDNYFRAIEAKEVIGKYLPKREKRKNSELMKEMGF
jgi:DNA-directed RNA polymerase subunit RPC12/RpoP